MKRSDLPEIGNAVVGCYSVDLYCSHPKHDDDLHAEWRARAQGRGVVDESPLNLTGETRAECLRRGRSLGWWVSRDEKRVLCPYHAKQMPR